MVVSLLAITVSGCSGDTSLNNEQPDTTYEWDKDNSSITEDLKPKDIQLTVDESLLPEGFTLDTEPAAGEDQPPAEIDGDQNFNYSNEDKTCFIGFNSNGQLLAESEDYTTSLVERYTDLMGKSEISVATLPVEGKEPLEVKVVETTNDMTTSFVALRGFDIDVPTAALDEEGNLINGKRAVSMSYSCENNYKISDSDFQNVLNAVTISYTTS